MLVIFVDEIILTAIDPQSTHTLKEVSLQIAVNNYMTLLGLQKIVKLNKMSIVTLESASSKFQGCSF